MGRRERRKRLRRARRRERRAADESARERGLPLPSLYPRGLEEETRDPRLRWRCLSARGGLQIGFTPTGARIPIDFDAPDAEHALAAALAERLHPEPGEA